MSRYNIGQECSSEYIPDLFLDCKSVFWLQKYKEFLNYLHQVLIICLILCGNEADKSLMRQIVGRNYSPLFSHSPKNLSYSS